MRRIGIGERRDRLARRHHLAPESWATDVVAVARGVVALHSTDPASVFLAAACRMETAPFSDLERALYDDRSLVRMLGMRRTMFVVPVELAPVVQAGCTRALQARERRKTVELLEKSGIAEDGERWLRQAESATMRALARRGEATASDLSGDVAALRQKIRFGDGTKWEGVQRVSTRVLFLLAAEGRIVRGRPLGSWTSSQYRWVPMESWLDGGLAEVPTDIARAELARQWLRAFGPGTAADLKWWMGWTTGQVRAALAAVGPAEVDLDGATGYVLAEDLAPVPPAEPWAALLPALDPTVMGWSRRQWYLGDHGPALFDRSGNAGPTVWWCGHVVGGWAQRKSGEIVFRLSDEIGVEGEAAVEAAAHRLASRLVDVRVTPRFRTPLERRLTA